MTDYINPTHGIIMAAIGAALFASLLVAWLWGRRRAYMRRRDSAVRELVGHADRLGESRLAVALNYAFAPTADIEAENARLRECYPLDASEPHKIAPHTPYSPSIAGTGSRPVNPLEERVAACELDIAGLAQHIAPLDAIIRDVADTKARLDALESKRGGEGLRVFKAADWTWVWTGEELHVRFKPCQWTPSGYSLPAELYEQVAGVTELHGPERARIVREFLEWKGAQ